MNLLTDNWIPVRPQQVGAARKISLQVLLCGSDRWELSLPRDDMELAALQLLICIVQVLLPSADKTEWVGRIAKPLSTEKLEAGCNGFHEWFQLDHAEHPFMQAKGVKAKKVTPMDKLLAGLDTSTNSRFVNAPDLAECICFGCAAIVLYNQANNAPSFGGGFKYGIRGSCPVSTFAQGHDLRTTIWLNVLSREFLDEYSTDWNQHSEQAPTWVEPIEEKSTIPAQQIGWLRGILWQPGRIELVLSEKEGRCSCCGHVASKLFTSFNKAKFNYTIDGLWEHPHSPLGLSVKAGQLQQRYFGFRGSSPAWTQLSRYICKQTVAQNGAGQQGQIPALVIQQIQKYSNGKAGRLELLVGGYRNNQAAILERRHEMLTLNQGWETHANIVHELVKHGLEYKTALRKTLYVCSKGIKKAGRKTKGLGLDLHEIGEVQFFRRSEDLMMQSLASIDFGNTLPTYFELDAQFKIICKSIFTELTGPYLHDPELFRTLTIARRSLQKHMREICVSQPSEDAA